MSNLEYKPGIYYDVTDADYRALDAVNQSQLKMFAKSARAAKYATEFPRDSSAFKLGRAADTLLFKPAEFDELFVEYAGSYLKDGKTWTENRSGAGWAAFKKEHEGKRQILTDDEAKEARCIARACHQHQVAAGLLVDGKAHTVVLWNDELTGLLCKAQLDYWQPDAMRVNDVKTARDVEPRAWGAASFKFGYHVQAAFYIDGLSTALDLAPEDFTFTDIAIEKSMYPDVVCYEVSRELIAYGRHQYRGWIQRYAKCKESGHWPGIAETSFMTTETPAWVRDDVEAAALYAETYNRAMAGE